MYNDKKAQDNASELRGNFVIRLWLGFAWKILHCSLSLRSDSLSSFLINWFHKKKKKGKLVPHFLLLWASSQLDSISVETNWTVTNQYSLTNLWPLKFAWQASTACLDPRCVYLPLDRMQVQKLLRNPIIPRILSALTIMWDREQIWDFNAHLIIFSKEWRTQPSWFSYHYSTKRANL